MAVEDKFYINLNQNLWGLVVAYAALGVSEHWGLNRLGFLSFIVSIGLSVSVLVTVAFYTYDYCRKKAETESGNLRIKPTSKIISLFGVALNCVGSLVLVFTSSVAGYGVATIQPADPAVWHIGWVLMLVGFVLQAIAIWLG